MVVMNASATMNFISAKMTVVIQYLVCVGIIASTVTITRSVVQTNLAKINANLEHLQRTPGPVSSNSKSTVDNKEALDYTKLHGYIVSNKERRYNYSRTVLDKMGIVAHRYVPLSYKSDVIHKAMEEYHSGNQKYMTDRYKKVFSNRMAFTHLFQQFVDDPIAELSSWRFFFEDDVSLHPSLHETLAPKVLAEGLEVAAGDGIMYLGICGPYNCEKKVILPSSVEAKRCAGACTHAFALTKWKAGGFLAYMDRLKTPEDPNVTSMYFDQLMRMYGVQVHKIWVLGSNLKSPQEGDHFGLVFQDRRNYPSVINAQERKH